MEPRRRHPWTSPLERALVVPRTIRPRRRRDPSPQNIHVAPRGGAATRPREDRGPTPSGELFLSAAVDLRCPLGISTSHPAAVPRPAPAATHLHGIYIAAAASPRIRLWKIRAANAPDGLEASVDGAALEHLREDAELRGLVPAGGRGPSKRSPPRNIRAAAAAESTRADTIRRPLVVPSDYPGGTRGGVAMRPRGLSAWQSRRICPRTIRCLEGRKPGPTVKVSARPRVLGLQC